MTLVSVLFRNVVFSCALLLAGAVLAQTSVAPEPAQENALKRMFAAGLASLRLVLTAIGSLGDGTHLGGEVWRVDIRGGEAQRISGAADLAWPVPSPSGQAVFALRGRQVVNISSDGSETNVGAAAEWRKLIGVAPDGTVLGFVTGRPRVQPAMLTANGEILLLSQPESDDEREQVAKLLQENRAYADGRQLIVERSQRGGRGYDVYLIAADGSKKNLSDCGDDACGQPSRSSDGRYALYIRDSARVR
jgi:hypothetical protein